MAKIGGLGRGLDSLFSENSENSSAAVEIRISEIEPNKNQPRKNFDETALAELADSISEHGLLQPILVRPTPSGRYQIVAGERRWRACRKAGLKTVKAQVRDFSDEEVMEIALIENLQRENLNPLEEAEGYSELIKQFGLTQEQAAARVNKSRRYVANSLRILQLDNKSLAALKDGKISLGHAKALLSIEDAALRSEALKAAVGGATVREIEGYKHKKPAPKALPDKPDRFYDEAALSLKNALRRNVRVKAAKNGRGTITIEFYSKDELSDIAKRLGGKQW